MKIIHGGGIALAENYSIKEISLFRAGGMTSLYAEPRSFNELLSVLELAYPNIKPGNNAASGVLCKRLQALICHGRNKLHRLLPLDR